MNRRNFVRTLSGILVSNFAVPAIVRAEHIMPINSSILLPKRYLLYGDGIHDDTEAMQAWADNKEVVWGNGEKVKEIQNKRLLISGTIHFPIDTPLKLLINNHIFTNHNQYASIEVPKYHLEYHPPRLRL
jgi:hypothetical protein